MCMFNPFLHTLHKRNAKTYATCVNFSTHWIFCARILNTFNTICVSIGKFRSLFALSTEKFTQPTKNLLSRQIWSLALLTIFHTLCMRATYKDPEIAKTLSLRNRWKNQVLLMIFNNDPKSPRPNAQKAFLISRGMNGSPIARDEAQQMKMVIYAGKNQGN